MTSPRTAPELRRSLWRLQGFQFLNGINFTIALGAPMVLAARALGAGEALIGTLVSFTPFMVLLQALAVNAAERHGHRRLVLAGWGTRSFMILLVAPLPLLGRWLPAPVSLGILAALLLAFNIIRGYTAIGWLPWISRVVPEHLRGQYFGREQLFVNAGVLLALAGSGQFLRLVDGAWKYSVLFLLCWLAGLGSVRFLAGVPAATTGVAQPAAKAARRVGELLAACRTVLACQPFRRLMGFVALNNLALAAFPGFLLLFQKDGLRMAEGSILLLAGCGTLGALLTGLFWGAFTDRHGSRPVLRLGGVGQLAVLGVWTLVAARLLPAPGALGVAAMYFLYGAVSAAVAIPQAKLMLAFCPKQELTVGATLHGMAAALCAGLAPLLWGLALEDLNRRAGAGATWPFALFFGTSAGLAVLAQLFLTRIREQGVPPTYQVMVGLVRGWPWRVVANTGIFGHNHAPRAAAAAAAADSAGR
ncbi:MAG: hypothetical protein WC789_10000 [Lentisphaeria bacterium]